MSAPRIKPAHRLPPRKLIERWRDELNEWGWPETWDLKPRDYGDGRDNVRGAWKAMNALLDYRGKPRARRPKAKRGDQ